MLPSGPAVMPNGSLLGVMPSENSVATPSGVIRPIFDPVLVVYQKLPSGPGAIRAGWVTPVENSVIVIAAALAGGAERGRGRRHERERERAPRVPGRRRHDAAPVLDR